jgi:hypothetical protein
MPASRAFRLSLQGRLSSLTRVKFHNPLWKSAMSFRTWFAALQVAHAFDRLQREWRRSPRRKRTSWSCLPADVLEVRSLLSSYTAATVSALLADINSANANGGANTITLAAKSIRC